jgi:hypothetical protein
MALARRSEGFDLVVVFRVGAPGLDPVDRCRLDGSDGFRSAVEEGFGHGRFVGGLDSA